MRVARIGLVCVVALSVSVMWAQAPPPMPKPAPELKRLNYYVGSWTAEGAMQPSEFGPGGKMTSKQRNTWFPGGFFLISQGDVTLEGMGALKEYAIYGYDTARKVYTYHAINSMGESEDYTGTVKGSDWTWNGESKVSGKPAKGKFSVHEESSTAYTMKFEVSTDGGKSWKSVFEGKASKAAAPAAKKESAPKK